MFANSKLDGFLNFLVSTHHLVIPIERCATPYIYTALIPSHHISINGNTSQNIDSRRAARLLRVIHANGKCKTFPAEHVMTNVQCSVCAEDDVSWEHRTVEDYK